MTIPKSKEKIIEEIKKRTGDAPDVTYKNYPIGDKIITLIYSNSVSSQNDINDFILRRLDEEGNKLLDKDIFSYVKNYIPNNLEAIDEKYARSGMKLVNYANMMEKN